MSEWVCYHGGIQREPDVITGRGPCPACGWSPPCDHIWMHFEAGEDASATLSAPAGSATWSEPVFVCTLCDSIQPEALADVSASSRRGTL